MCQPTVSRTHSEKSQNNFISLDNSLNDDFLYPVRHGIQKRVECTETAHSSDLDNEQDDHDDAVSLQPGQAETRDLDFDAQPIMSEHNELQAQQVDDRFLKYKTDSPSEETQQVLLDMFGEDACVKKSSSGTGVILDKTQTDILNESWRISMPYRLTAYRDSYKSSFPVHEKSEEFLKVPSLDDIVEHFLIKCHSGKATFKRSRSFFTPHLKEM